MGKARGDNPPKPSTTNARGVKKKKRLFAKKK